ncbi:MAG: HPr family phosphocarrier protein [Verrucomicrobia bacterium]|jgi:phosphocarrier protein|nr:HPr family phosphocarrier protein [Verrucomicrobiota bacterium]
MAVSKKFKITNKQGLHARPAAMFVRAAARYSSEIWVTKDDDEVNGKSIMGLMMLAAEYGSEVEVRAEGADEQAAIEELDRLFAGGFGNV